METFSGSSVYSAHSNTRSSSSSFKYTNTNQHTPTRESQSPRDSTSLRFPVAPTTPATDERVSSWVESITPARMSAPSEDGSALGDSTYDFIDTDTESQTDNATTESIASTDFGRPDDIASLADTEQSDDGSGDDNSSQQASTQPFPGFNQAVEDAFETPTIGRSSAVIVEDMDRILSQSIEFEEPFNLGAENVSVKHTVVEFDEEETSRIAKDMSLPTPPPRLAVTIRQTMTKQGLSTREPLRILYVGSHSAKQDIIVKLASTITASIAGDKRAKHIRDSASQLYNVVPVSAFGSERTPEIELMHSSGYQIKVEDCWSAHAVDHEDSPSHKSEIFKLTTEDRSYQSVPEGKGYKIEPQWELPHISVIYCSDSDDLNARRTRAYAREFMNRHNIPSIVISHKQMFDRAQFMPLDQHSIHMCLESRDSNGRMNMIHQRLPIDLASFLNIDARQMNRNLAYLTGFYEPLDEAEGSASAKAIDGARTDKGHAHGLSGFLHSLREQYAADWQKFVMHVGFGLLLFTVLPALMMSIPSYRYSNQRTISINSKIVSDVPSFCTTSITNVAVAPSITAATSVAQISTSTRTITVTQAQPSGPNGLSVVPSKELSTTLPKVQNSKSNKSLCSAEILGNREILIRIPSATKLTWLNKEAISVNITRDNYTVDTERAYSSDEGIVLLLPKKEAYGVLNITIVTTKRPKVNETFNLDFGVTAVQAIQNVFGKIASLGISADPFSEFISSADKLVEDARMKSQATLNRLEGARKLAVEQASSASGSLTGLAKSMSSETAKRSAQISKEVSLQLAEEMQKLNKIQEPINNGILSAQVQSKLLWLKMQGKQDEYARYQNAAYEAIRNKRQEARKAQKEALKGKFNRVKDQAMKTVQKSGLSKKSCSGKKQKA
ncbi:hypothetical protein HYALB_00003477 [Hymenoscyphus albidus]|uniref:Uncharacterized protein n=1 Tax=Hymenoscyphus albidus TaxID=595503 RepID=A0A9N9LSQ8_9HELO|nr:hypothetical protein HYALB_00003477 [Hymenoscyphus albidus]